MSDALKPGDVVRPKGRPDSPAMAIARQSETVRNFLCFDCSWYDDEGNLRVRTFYAGVLEKVEARPRVVERA